MRFVALLIAVPWLIPSHAEGVELMPRPITSAVLRYRDDAIGLRLAPAGARLVDASDRSNAEDRAPSEPRTRLGLASVDAVAAELPGLTFEREFPTAPEIPPGVSSMPRPGEPPLDAFWIVHLPPSCPPERAIAVFEAATGVQTAWRIAIVHALAVPDDSLWSAAYYFQQPSGRDLDAVAAWDVTRGDSAVVVAIIDTGVLPYHPDMAGQIWTNLGERNGLPNVDDDGNGFVDDTWGWDFVDVADPANVREGEDGRDPDNDPNDFAGHGTAVASTVAAHTNNRIGIAGTAWNARLMPLRIGWSSPTYPSGEGDVGAIARAVDYATRMGATIINCSFTTAEQPDLVAAVDGAIRAGVTVVTASGNFGVIHYLAERFDVISVAATDASDRVTSWSTTRPYVDLVAPGDRIATATVDRPGPDSLGLRQSTYTRASGTSFSSPLVAGAAALVQSARLEHGQPPLSPMDMLLRLTDTADDIRDVNPEDLGYGSGRLNLLSALTDTSGSRVAATRVRLAGCPAVLRTETPPWRIALPTLDRRLVLIEGEHGTTLGASRLSAVPVGGVAAADLGPGRGAGLFVATIDGRLQGFEPDLDPLPGWPVSAPVARAAALREPVLADLDGDGTVEILWAGGRDGTVYAWTADGVRVAGFPRLVATGDLSIAAGDLNGVPGAEIVVAAASGRVLVMGRDGTTLPGWPIQLQSDQRAPVIARLGRARRPVAVFAGGIGVWAYDVFGYLVWNVALPGSEAGAPALADLDGVGGDEVVLLRSYTEPIAVIDSAGTVQATWQTRPVTGAIIDPLLVAPAASGGAPAILASVIGSGVVALGVDARRLRGYPKAGIASAFPACGDFDGDGRTEILAGSDTDSMLYLYDAGPGTWRDGAVSWPTARGNEARTGSHDGPGLAPLDGRAPPTVLDLAAATPGETTAMTWTVPRDDRGIVLYGLTRHCSRRSGLVVSESTIETFVPHAAPGATERFVESGLDENATYTFRLRSRDANANWSAPSNEITVATPARRPSAVSDLHAIEARDSTVTFAWTATGDDDRSGRPRIYRLRAAEATAGGDWFESAPIRADVAASRAAGETEVATLAGFVREHRYRVALLAEDDAGNLSTLSNETLTWLGPLVGARGPALACERTPTRFPVRLYWQADASSSSQARSIRVVDVAGRSIAHLPLAAGDAGIATWNGDEHGRRAPPGLYFARLEAIAARATARFVVLH
jgi:subtilisin family serine protease